MRLWLYQIMENLIIGTHRYLRLFCFSPPIFSNTTIPFPHRLVHLDLKGAPLKICFFEKVYWPPCKQKHTTDPYYVIYRWMSYCFSVFSFYKRHWSYRCAVGMGRYVSIYKGTDSNWGPFEQCASMWGSIYYSRSQAIARNRYLLVFFDPSKLWFLIYWKKKNSIHCKVFQYIEF